MSGIICAIRGGAASQPTIEQAILTAKKTGIPLYFLYVVNVDFLMSTPHSRVQTITKELQKLGEFILLAAQSKAEGHGLHAEGVLREGNVGEEIIGLCHEIQASHVILGRPRQEEANVFTHERLSEFARHIEEETGAEVIFSEEAAE